VANELQYKAQFRTRKRRPDEDLAGLADDLRRLVGRAYPAMPGQIQDEMVRDQFIEALTPISLRVRLQEHPPATVHEAVETALHLEKVWGSVTLPSQATQQLVGPYGESSPSQLVVAAVDAPPPVANRAGRDDDLHGMGRRPEYGPRKWKPKDESCWVCGQQGHRARHCPRGAAGRSDGPPPADRSRRSGNC